ncbi:hypothetical protein D5086_020035 [Populus alba]|uniref:Uncharacterized protein n=1 Tax=Populus alba TaxID=43335 RepID=A0ACC4BJK2_POPAL
MMLQYRDLAKLKTKKIVFEDVIAARDSATLEHLKELSSKRRVIEESINQTSYITEAIAREISGGLTSRCEQERLRLEHYLPLLENFISHADLISSNSQMVQWTSQLKIRWSSATSSSSFFDLRGPKFFQIDNLRFELAMIHFLYGATLRERASEFLSTDLKQSAFIFREAAGVFHYLAHEVIPSLQSPISAERPSEASSALSAAMSFICLAEAQAVYTRRAEEKGNTGFGVLAKLHYGVVELLSEATSAIHSGTGEGNTISSRFLEFISSCKALHELRSKKHLAEGLRNDGQVGASVGVLCDALISSKKKTPGEDSWKAVFKNEIEIVANTLRKFEYENEFVWREKIPHGDELPSPQEIHCIVPLRLVFFFVDAKKSKAVLLLDFALSCVRVFMEQSGATDWFYLRSILCEIPSDAKKKRVNKEQQLALARLSSLVQWKDGCRTHLSGGEPSASFKAGEANVLVDLFLEGNLDFGIPGLHDAAKEVLKNFQLSDLPEVTYLEPGQSFEMKAKNGSKVGVKAPAGPVLGPPWQHHEKGYLINSPQGQLTLYCEPHCVYNKDFLEKERANIVITLVIGTLLPQFTLVSGLEDAVQLAKLLKASRAQLFMMELETIIDGTAVHRGSNAVINAGKQGD